MDYKSDSNKIQPQKEDSMMEEQQATEPNESHIYKKGGRGRGFSRPSSQLSQASGQISPRPGSNMSCSTSTSMSPSDNLRLVTEKLSFRLRDTENRQIRTGQEEDQHQPNKRNLSGTSLSPGKSPNTQRGNKKKLKNSKDSHDRNNNNNNNNKNIQQDFHRNQVAPILEQNTQTNSADANQTEPSPFRSAFTQRPNPANPGDKPELETNLELQKYAADARRGGSAQTRCVPSLEWTALDYLQPILVQLGTVV
ncbi:putative uncharacterized protein DDB_G0272516 [Leptopilina heterotoma]|uniref:putative uncharacterized protein DDB_G0272516 n=1 Tax=Leptopilina heterotoma TaxID=63436 RepID=UPI001CA9A594|nr:putative uncharacterized protein DDB_G0272516 [Leptopilina heterotoma]